MKQILVIEEQEYFELLEQIKQLSKRVEILEKGLTEYVGTAEAMRITGLGRDALYDIRQAGKVEYRFEGRKVLYLRNSLIALTESGKLRRKRR